jgi:TonB family protein
MTPTPEPTTAASAPVATGHSTGGRPAGEVVERFVPEVPEQILRTIRGKVKVSVEVAIDPFGAVTEAKLGSPSGGRYFDRLALDAARRWKFKPASDVASTRLVRFEFRRDGCEASSD